MPNPVIYYIFLFKQCFLRVVESAAARALLIIVIKTYNKIINSPVLKKQNEILLMVIP